MDLLEKKSNSEFINLIIRWIEAILKSVQSRQVFELYDEKCSKNAKKSQEIEKNATKNRILWKKTTKKEIKL